MADRKNPFLQTGFGEYKGIHRMPFGLQARAIMHETNRQRAVASLLLDLYMMAYLRIIPEEQPLALAKAAQQNLSGNDKDITQAAHCIPRQLLIGTRAPQDLLQKVFPDRAWALRVIFGETDILPVNFNICDSRVERLGLNKAFRTACQFIIDAGHHSGQLETYEIIVLVEAAYGKYKAITTRAYSEAILRLKDKLKPKFMFPEEKAKFIEQLQITEQYAETLRESPGKEKGISMWKVEGMIKIYTTPYETDH